MPIYLAVDQYQICNPQASNKSIGCTSLTSANLIFQELLKRNKEVGLNVDQIATMGRFLGTSSRRIMFQSVDGRGQSALNAQETLHDVLQAELPNNQWQKEVSIWFATALAKEQAWALEWATGIRNVDLTSPAVREAYNFTPPTTPQAAKQCQNQLVRDSGTHMNFSVLGMVLILIIGGLIIVIGLSVDVVVGWFRKRNSKNEWKSQQWDADESLALQRAAYDGSGLWGNGQEVPSSLVFVPEESSRAGAAWRGPDDRKVYSVVNVHEG